MKSIILLLSAAFCLSGFAYAHTVALNPDAAANSVKETVYYKVIAEKATLRSGPNREFNVVLNIHKNALVKLVSNDFSDWYVVEFEGVNGFVNKNDIEKTSAVSSQATDKIEVTTTEKPENGSELEIITDNTKLKSGPGSKYDDVSIIKKGEIVKLISGDFGDWYTVSYKDLHGFVLKANVEVVGETTKE